MHFGFEIMRVVTSLFFLLLLAPLAAGANCNLAEGLYKRIMRHEGWHLCAYNDHLGNPTIGVGHLLKRPIPDQLCWSQGRVERVFHEDVTQAERFARHDVRDWHHLPRLTHEVLTELAFQLGGTGLAHFRHMLFQIDKGDWNRAADELLNSRLAQQTPNRTKELACLLRKQAQ